MDKQQLLRELESLQGEEYDIKGNNIAVMDLLLAYIDDNEISKEVDKINKY